VDKVSTILFFKGKNLNKVYIGLLAFLILFLYISAINPYLQMVKRNKKLIETYVYEMKNISSRVFEKQNYAEIEKNKLERYFSTIKNNQIDNQNEELVNKITFAASKNRINIVNTKKLSTFNTEYTVSFRIYLSASGRWEDIIKFIHEVEQKSDPINISELKIKLNEEKSEMLNFDVTIERMFIKG
jgi:Tfp pilus assembly protein PilO